MKYKHISKILRQNFPINQILHGAFTHLSRKNKTNRKAVN